MLGYSNEELFYFVIEVIRGQLASHWIWTLHVFLHRAANLSICAPPANGYKYTNLGERFQHTMFWVMFISQQLQEASVSTDLQKRLFPDVAAPPEVEQDQTLPVPLSPALLGSSQSKIVFGNPAIHFCRLNGQACQLPLVRGYRQSPV